jgi:murein DD-endopeptidase MepM/ murein hydrolase activator NlpD
VNISLFSAFALVFLAAGSPVAGATNPQASWPPEPLLEMRVPFGPTAFPSDGRTYLVYELRVTNLAPSALAVRRLEVRDADHTAAAPIAAYEGETLANVLQHFDNPAVGDRMPTPADQHHRLAAGESIILFLTLSLEAGASIPARLSHRLFTADATVDGAVLGTRGVELREVGAPLEDGPWRAFSGAAANTSHHRRQIYVLSGHAALPNRCAIDWVRTENSARHSGSPDENRNYLSYGARVMAVEDATVVSVHDGVADNLPGHRGAESLKLSRDTIGGNTIVLDLGHGQFAHYMHLQPGTLRVKSGERVRRGQVIAHVGNSGSSFEPHLHFEVTTSPLAIVGEGLPYLIDEYEVATSDGRKRRRRELPLEGSLVHFRLQ